MRKIMLAVLALSLAGFWAVPALAGKACVVTVWQDGLERTSTSIQTGTYFTLKGAGFRTWSPAKVCLTGQLCVKSDVDSDGSFTQLSRLDYPGTYKVNVYQLKSRNGGNSDLMYSGEIVISE